MEKDLVLGRLSGKTRVSERAGGSAAAGSGGCDVEGGWSGRPGILALVEMVGGCCRLSAGGRQGPGM